MVAEFGVAPRALIGDDDAPLDAIVGHLADILVRRHQERTGDGADPTIAAAARVRARIGR